MNLNQIGYSNSGNYYRVILFINILAHQLIFFGAGASRPYGIPTMQEMVIEFEESLEKDTPQYRLYSKIKTIQKKYYKNKNVDIESIFSVVYGLSENISLEDMGHTQLFLMSEFFNLENFIIDEKNSANLLKKDLENFIKTKCHSSLDDQKIIKIYEKSYAPLLENLISKKINVQGREFCGNWKIYTTNYDLMFEGFAGNYFTLNDFFVKEGASQNYIFTPNASVRNYGFVKLHGSINWLRRKDGEIIKKGTIGPLIQQTEGEVMIFPIQQKDLYLFPWDIQFQDFKNELYSTSEWIVIGYAFNDEFILNVMKEVLNQPGKKLVIINPNAIQLKKQKFEEKYWKNIVSIPIKFGSKYFKSQIEDFRREQKEVEINLETRAAILEIITKKPHKFEKGENTFGSGRIKSNQENTELKFQGDSSYTKHAKLFWKIIHNSPFEEDLKLSIFTNVGEPVFCKLFYREKMLPSFTSLSKKLDPMTGRYEHEIILKAEDVFVKD